MIKISFLICSILCSVLSSQLQAFVRSDVAWLVQEGFNRAHAVLALHPYQRESVPPRWALYKHGLLALQHYGELLLREQGLAYEVEIVTQQRSRQRVDYRYRLQGYDICDLRTALTRLHDGHVYQRGRYPVTEWSGGAFVWPARELAVESVKDMFVARLPRIEAVTRCLLATTRGYVPVFDFNVRVGALPYRVRTDGYEVLGMQRLFYDLQGEFHIYRENAVRSNSKELFLIKIQEEGRLINRYFDTAAMTDDGASTEQLLEPSNIFDYPDTDKRMAQVSTFAHANLMLQWFEKLGFSWYGHDRVILMVHANFDPAQRRNSNNAFYAPPTRQQDGTHSKPHILIGDGDGRSLQNLALDGDVIAHEFGHHVIFKYLPATGGQAGAIHEGLADYFTYARTGNPCLAESTCPSGSHACQLEGQCMRYADHNYSWYTLQGLGIHIEGQVLSAMLWDLRTEFALAADDVNKLAFNAVQHFTSHTQLRDFIDSLLMADRDLFSGDHCVDILNAALGRGLQKFIGTGIDCGNGITSKDLIEKTSAESNEKLAGVYERRKGGCGTILSSPAASPYVLIILLLPLLFGFVRHARVLHRHSHPSDARTLRH